MKRLILMSILGCILLAGCSSKKNITFEATIASVNEESIIVTTDKHVGFDEASVELSVAQIEGDLTEGTKVEITIKPEIRETYPVQVTATKVKVISGN